VTEIESVSPKISRTKALVRFSFYRAAQEAAPEENSAQSLLEHGDFGLGTFANLGDDEGDPCAPRCRFQPLPNLLALPVGCATAPSA